MASNKKHAKSEEQQEKKPKTTVNSDSISEESKREIMEALGKKKDSLETME